MWRGTTFDPSEVLHYQTFARAQADAIGEWKKRPWRTCGPRGRPARPTVLETDMSRNPPNRLKSHQTPSRKTTNGDDRGVSSKRNRCNAGAFSREPRSAWQERARPTVRASRQRRRATHRSQPHLKPRKINLSQPNRHKREARAASTAATHRSRPERAPGQPSISRSQIDTARRRGARGVDATRRGSRSITARRPRAFPRSDCPSRGASAEAATR